MSVALLSHVSKYAQIHKAVTSVVVTKDTQWMETCALVSLRAYIHTDMIIVTFAWNE